MRSLSAALAIESSPTASSTAARTIVLAALAKMR
jgi:hypothetical protein